MKKCFLTFLIFVLSLFVVGCAGKNVSQNDGNQKENSREVSDSSPDSRETSREDPVDAEDSNDYIEDYENFLKDELAAYCGKAPTYWYSTEDGYIFDAKKSYTFTEFKEAVFSRMKDQDVENPEENYKISKGYLDAGQDGKKELALCFQDISEASYLPNWIFVFQVLDGRMELVLSRDYGYRSFASINQAGIVFYGGSGGAAVHVDSANMIADDGKIYRVYDEEVDYDAASFYVPDSLHRDQEIGMDFGTDLPDLGIHRYSFELYEDNPNGKESYADDYYKNSVYFLMRIDENMNEVEDLTMYEDGSPYKAFMSAYDLTWLTPGEAEKAYEEHKKAIGCTDQMLDAPDVEWEEIANPSQG